MKTSNPSTKRRFPSPGSLAPVLKQRHLCAVGGGSSGSNSSCSRFLAAVSRQLHAMSYLCPGLFPWVDCGPATEMSGELHLLDLAASLATSSPKTCFL